MSDRKEEGWPSERATRMDQFHDWYPRQVPTDWGGPAADHGIIGRPPWRPDSVLLRLRLLLAMSAEVFNPNPTIDRKSVV